MVGYTPDTFVSPILFGGNCLMLGSAKLPGHLITTLMTSLAENIIHFFHFLWDIGDGTNTWDEYLNEYLPDEWDEYLPLTCFTHSRSRLLYCACDPFLSCSCTAPATLFLLSSCTAPAIISFRAAVLDVGVASINFA